jgi:GntR family transcriptional regulator / MocR family aminotransferase
VRIEQHAFADFVARGELDRHLRRMRVRYRGQRDALIRELARELPEVTVTGISAGLHVNTQLPASDDEQTIREEAERRGVGLATMIEYRSDAHSDPPTLMLGYGRVPEPAIVPGVHEIAEAVRASRAHGKERGGDPPL